MTTIFENDSKTARLVKFTLSDVDSSCVELIEECVQYVDSLLQKNPTITVYGRECKQQRDVGFFSDEIRGYNYSNKTMQSQPLNDCLKSLMKVVNRLCDANYNAILVNRYNTGCDYISAHCDNEKSIDQTSVATLSYGSQRTFRIRDKSTKKIIL